MQPKKDVETPASTEELVKIVNKKKKRSRFSQFLWSIGTLLLLAFLGLQGIYRYSEEITAWWPPAEELVNTTCELLSCPVKAPNKETCAVKPKQVCPKSLKTVLISIPRI